MLGLVLAGWVVQALDDGGSVGEALIERRNADGSLVWRQIGYAGHNPIAVHSELPYTSITQLEVRADGGLVAIAAIEGWQSILNTVLGIDPEDGSIAWVDAWTGQVIPKLGYDSVTDNLMISEPRSRIIDFDPEVSVDDAETLVPAQTVLTKLLGAERIWWRAELEWPGWVALDVTRPVAVATDSYPAAYTGVSGRDREQAAHSDRFALTRHDWTGALDCVQPLPELTHGQVEHLRALADDRLVLTTGTRSPNQEPEVAAALILLRNPASPGQSP